MWRVSGRLLEAVVYEGDPDTSTFKFFERKFIACNRPFAYMASFSYHYQQNPSRFHFFGNLGHFNVTLLAKFKRERENEMSSSVSSKKTSSRKWPISK